MIVVSIAAEGQAELAGLLLDSMILPDGVGHTGYAADHQFVCYPPHERPDLLVGGPGLCCTGLAPSYLPPSHGEILNSPVAE